jgi:hypothetical protein
MLKVYLIFVSLNMVWNLWAHYELVQQVTVM